MEQTERRRSTRASTNFKGKTLRKSCSAKRDVRIPMKTKTEEAEVKIDTASAMINILNIFSCKKMGVPVS
jgi:hypothetical protein